MIAIGDRKVVPVSMLPFALAGQGSYRAVKGSLHAQTNQQVIEKFLDVKITISKSEDGDALFEFLR